MTVALARRVPARGPGRPVAAGVVLLALLVTLLGCGSDDPQAPPAQDGAAQQEPVSPLDDCAALSAPPPRAPAGDPPAAATAPAALPELSLPCFTGDEPVALADLRGPAVVNLWASWCAPCREELPVLQQYADRTAGSVHVVGVVHEDSPGPAAALATEFGVSFPGLFDREGRVLDALSALPELGLPAPPALGIPVTFFVDADGRIVHARNAPLDAAELERLAAEHLGVTP